MPSPGGKAAARTLSPDLDDMVMSLQAIRRQPKAVLEEAREVIARARRFNQEVVIPQAADIDRKIQEDPCYLPLDLIKTANEWGIFTWWIPRIFGGKGYSMPTLSYFVEEIASACAGISNLLGVHYLGIATVVSTWNTKVAAAICRDVVEGQKNGTPCLLSLALTEPDAGTDMEDPDLMDKGTITCHAQKVPGGYRVNGTKVFISNGHLSTYHILFAFADTNKPSGNLVMLAMKKDSPGLSLGKVERKMGQKACPASELIFKDCFVPDDMVCMDPKQAARLSRSQRDTTAQIVDYLFATSRAGVCAFGTGVARGAYETALDYAANTVINGKLLLNQEWAQAILAEMHKNVTVARITYNEANYAISLYGMYKTIQTKAMFYLLKYLPSPVMRLAVAPILKQDLSIRVFRWLHFDRQTDKEIQRTSGWGSLAKFSGTDAAVANTKLALQLMGPDGLRHRNLAEKHLRDAKVMQIYEGTNQLNRINVFKCLIAPHYPQAAVFDEAPGKARC